MIITCPLYTQVSKKKKFYFNLNVYRNAPYHLLNAVKIAFKEAIEDQLRKLPRFRTIELVFTVFPATLREFDVSNICSVVDKFFSDALVEFGKLPDDNFKHLLSVKYRYGELDRENPRVDVEIIPHEFEKEEPMKIILEQHEIFAAMTAYIRTNMPNLVGPDQHIEFDIKNGRGDSGLEASVTIGAPGSAAAPQTAPAPQETKPEPVKATTPVTTPRQITDAPENRQEAAPSLLNTEPAQTAAPATGGLFGSKPATTQTAQTESIGGAPAAAGAEPTADANASSQEEAKPAEPVSIFNFSKN